MEITNETPLIPERETNTVDRYWPGGDVTSEAWIRRNLIRDLSESNYHYLLYCLGA
jgi:hypothetical protein